MYVAVVSDGEGEKARGTCSGALAKSPIITSKLDFAGGGLSDTGALWRMKHCTEIEVESLLPLSAVPTFSLLPPHPFYCPSLPLCHLPCPTFLISSLSSHSTVLRPPCILSVSLTPGCLDGSHSMSSLSSFLFPPW